MQGAWLGAGEGCGSRHDVIWAAGAEHAPWPDGWSTAKPGSLLTVRITRDYGTSACEVRERARPKGLKPLCKLLDRNEQTQSSALRRAWYSCHRKNNKAGQPGPSSYVLSGRAGRHRHSQPVSSLSVARPEGRKKVTVDLVVIRLVFILVLTVASGLLQPFGLSRQSAAVAGLVLSIAVILFELRLRAISLKRLIGAAIGSVLGILGAYLFSLVIRNSIPTGSTQSFLQLLVMLLMAYVGLVIGANKGDLLNLSALGGVFGGEKQGKRSYKILDTSVIIDGRIADIAETGFLDGVLVIPQFVLRELQLVADSADSMKRNRGRRGLDILQRIQKMAHLNVQIVEDDFPHVREVDMKLIELAKVYDCKVITNDFNLNKVAQLHGVEVLNINELANSLKPIVLPGETMRVFILKEGKEYNQGVAYLDDGTMVVVDNAKRMISKTIDISVTSVLQTTAGKMIFGKFDDRTHAVVAEKHERAPRKAEAVSEG